MITIHGTNASGNCYKLQLLLAHLARPYRWREVDLFSGATRTPEFLAKNPNGKVPLLELEDGRCLAESNAILCYLAESTPYLSNDPWLRAQTLQWQFFEQYSHEPYVAVARFIGKFLPEDHPRRAELARLQERAHQALAVMDRELATRDFMVVSGYSIADIALYAYTHDAPAGGIGLAGYPHVQAWLRRVESMPRFVMQRN